MVIDDASYWNVVCHRLPRVKEVLTLLFGGMLLDRQGWSAVTGERVAKTLRKRFNKALKANYVKKVIVKHGQRPGGDGKLWFCPQSVAEEVGLSIK